MGIEEFARVDDSLSDFGILVIELNSPDEVFRHKASPHRGPLKDATKDMIVSRSDIGHYCVDFSKAQAQNLGVGPTEYLLGMAEFVARCNSLHRVSAIIPQDSQRELMTGQGLDKLVPLYPTREQFEASSYAKPREPSRVQFA